MLMIARRLLAVSMLLLMAGCATNQQVVNNRFTLPETISAKEGAILIRLVGVQPLSAFNAKWQSIKIVSKKDERKTELHDTAPPFAGYSLFMGRLPEGEYEIAGLESLGPAPGAFGVIPALIIMGMTSDQQSLQAQLGAFTVKAGTLTNLGVVVSALPEEKGKPMKLAVLADEAGQASALASAEPQARERLRNMPSIGWKETPDAAAAAKAVGIVREHARNISALETTQDQRVLVGSALGMVHVRSPEGNWSTMSVGALDNITYVRALSGGRIFAGTDSGNYFLWTPGQPAWRQHKFDDGESKIVHVEQMDEHGFAIVATSMHMPTFSKPIQNKLYFKARLDEEGRWKELVSIDNMSAVGKMPVIYAAGELRLVFNHIGISRTADLYRVDPVTLEKKQEKLDYWVTDIYRLPDGQLMMHRMNGMTTYSSVSGDDGKTWRHNPASGGPDAPRFANAKKGVGFVLKSVGWSSSLMGLVQTENGGDSWTATGAALEGAWIVRFVNDQLFVKTHQKLMSSADGGKTWKVEWPLPPLPR